MASVARWDEGALPPPLDQMPALMGLEIVVMSAQPVEEIEGRDSRLGEVLTMVVLQAGPGGAAFDRAARMQEVQGGALVGVGVPTMVVYAGQSLALGQNSDDERILGGDQVLDDTHGGRAVPGDLAQLAFEGDTPKQRLKVDSDHDPQRTAGQLLDPSGPDRRGRVCFAGRAG